ncbi:hypothetical protein [Alteribacter keqinensis]|nr:hypothetical protein [Alteribacter keqinensis]
MEITPYADPLMVMLVSGYFVKVPLLSIKEQLKEVLEMAPEEGIQTEIEKTSSHIKEKYGFDESILRVSKVGSKLFIEVDFIVDTHKWEPSIKDQDRIREEFFER